jgi:hypothetical protein
MTGPIAKLTTAAVLAMTLGTTGCLVHDRYGYRSGYYRPGVTVHHGSHRDRHYRDHDRYDRHDRHDRWDGRRDRYDGRWRR